MSRRAERAFGPMTNPPLARSLPRAHTHRRTPGSATGLPPQQVEESTSILDPMAVVWPVLSLRLADDQVILQEPFGLGGIDPGAVCVRADGAPDPAFAQTKASEDLLPRGSPQLCVPLDNEVAEVIKRRLLIR